MPGNLPISKRHIAQKVNCLNDLWKIRFPRHAQFKRFVGAYGQKEGFEPFSFQIFESDVLTESGAERSIADVPQDEPLAIRFTWRRGDLFAFAVSSSK